MNPREQRIAELSGGRGYGFLTSSQRNEVNALGTSAPTAIPVVTSNAAQNNYNDIKTQHADLVAGMANQASNVAATTKASSVTPTSTLAPAKLPTTTSKSGVTVADYKYKLPNGSVVTIGDPTINREALAGAQYLEGGSGVDPLAPGFVPGQTTAANTPPKTGLELELDKANADYSAAAQEVNDTISKIQSGVIPLDQGQLAQIEGLKQAFNDIIQKQALTNAGAVGTANIRGYQTGAGEYDPTFQVQTIGKIISSGQQIIADYNIQMAKAVAEMTEGFRSDNINVVERAYSRLEQANRNRIAAIEDTITRANNKIKDAQEQAAAAEKKQFDQVTKPIQDLSKEVAKNGAPADVIAAVSAATTVAEAVAAAGDYIQTGTGDIGDYLFYKRQAMAAGVTPVSYEAYMLQKQKDEEAAAYAKAYQTALGTAQGKARGTPPVKPEPGSITTPEGQVIPRETQDRALDILNQVSKLENSPSLSGAVGASFQKLLPNFIGMDRGLQPGRAGFLAELNRLKGLLSIDNMKLLKGQGAVSDAERELLASIGTSLNPDMTEQDFLTELDRVREITSKLVAPTGNTLLVSEQQAKRKLTDFVNNNRSNPELIKQFQTAVAALEKTLGRAATSQEVLEAFPEFSK